MAREIMTATGLVQFGSSTHGATVAGITTRECRNAIHVVVQIGHGTFVDMTKAPMPSRPFPIPC